MSLVPDVDYGRVELLLLEANAAVVLTPDLLHPKQKARLTEGAHPTAGHCYHAAEAVYHILGGKEGGWTPYCASFEDPQGKQTHWWIEHPSHGRLDPTAEQFAEPPYHLGKPKGFLTKRPSRRALNVMQRLVGAFQLEAARGAGD